MSWRKGRLPAWSPAVVTDGISGVSPLRTSNETSGLGDLCHPTQFHGVVEVAAKDLVFGGTALTRPDDLTALKDDGRVGKGQGSVDVLLDHDDDHARLLGRLERLENGV